MKNKWENPRCNFCNQTKNDVVLDKVETWIAKGKYRLVRCRNCGLVYLSPRPKKAYISKYYPPETYWGIDLVKSDKVRDNSSDYDYTYKGILRRKKAGVILDIGAGTGLFLSNFKNLGWKTNGVEFSKMACQYAKKIHGLTFVNGSFPEVSLPAQKYDVITLNGCLEHLYKPKESLAKIHTLLKTSGILEMNMPNFDSLGRILFGKQWYALQPPSHLYQFTPETITKMLCLVGFKKIGVRHDYFSTNKYILFESFRLKLSPKFKGANISKFITNINTHGSKNFSLKIEVGKILSRFTSLILALLEILIKKGEVITIYAKKN